MFADVNPSNNGRQQLQKAVIAHAILRPTLAAIYGSG